MTFVDLRLIVVVAGLGTLVGSAEAVDPPLAPPPRVLRPIDPGGVPVPPHLRTKKKPAPKADVKLPKWLDKKVTAWKAGPAGKTKAFPTVYTYQYKGKLVYFFQGGNMPQVFDADGKLLGIPWGGFTGKGDGKLPDFKAKATDRKLFWQDPSAGDKEIAHYKRRIKSIEDRLGKAQALKSINFWLRSASSPAVKKFLKQEQARLQKTQ